MLYPRCALLLAAVLSIPNTEAHSAPPPADPSGLQHAVPATAPVATPPQQTGAGGVATAERQALHAELAQRMRRTQAEVAALQNLYDATTDPVRRQALKQRIEAAKQEGRLDFFRIQLRYAQAAGRTAQAQEIEAVIDAQMKLPMAPLPPLPEAASQAATTAPRTANDGAR